MLVKWYDFKYDTSNTGHLQGHICGVMYAAKHKYSYKISGH